jgi:hypothetical protein
MGMTGLKLFAWLTPCEYDDKLANFLSPLVNLANFCLLIWGSVVVFGAFSLSYLDKFQRPGLNRIKLLGVYLLDLTELGVKIGA